MRTKALLFVAAFTAAGLATSLAQTNVYSLNVVGYVNVQLPPSTLANGFSIVCNPLNNSNNWLSSILPTVPENTELYRYIGGTFDIATFSFGEWDKPDMQLNPGEAFWLRNPGGATNITFVGEVVQGNNTNPVPSGFSLRGSQVPQSLTLLDTNTDPTNHGVVDLNYPASRIVAMSFCEPRS